MLLLVPLVIMTLAYSLIVSKLWKGLRREIRHNSSFRRQCEYRQYLLSSTNYYTARPYPLDALGVFDCHFNRCVSLFLSSSTSLFCHLTIKNLVCFFCCTEDGFSFLSFRSKLHLKEAVVKQMTPYSLVESYRPYWRKCCLHFLSWRWLH